MCYARIDVLVFNASELQQKGLHVINWPKNREREHNLALKKTSIPWQGCIIRFEQLPQLRT